MGAQQFIEIIFNSSAGRVVFDAYKDSSQLPEVIAKDNGNEETAHYLERITKRYIFRRMRSVYFGRKSCGNVFFLYLSRAHWLLKLNYLSFEQAILTL